MDYNNKCDCTHTAWSHIFGTNACTTCDCKCFTKKERKRPYSKLDVFDARVRVRHSLGLPVQMRSTQ